MDQERKEMLEIPLFAQERRESHRKTTSYDLFKHDYFLYIYSQHNYYTNQSIDQREHVHHKFLQLVKTRKDGHFIFLKICMYV